MKNVKAKEIMDAVRLQIGRNNTRIMLFHWMMNHLQRFIGKPINKRVITHLEKMLNDSKTTIEGSALKVQLVYSGINTNPDVAIKFYGVIEGRSYSYDYGFEYTIIRDKDGLYNEALTLNHAQRWIDACLDSYDKNSFLLNPAMAEFLAEKYNEIITEIETFKTLLANTSIKYVLDFSVDNDIQQALNYREYGVELTKP